MELVEQSGRRVTSPPRLVLGPDLFSLMAIPDRSIGIFCAHLLLAESRLRKLDAYRKSPEYKAYHYAYNNLPDVAEKRHRLAKEYRLKPEFIDREKKRAAKRFKDKKPEIMAYRKARPETYAYGPYFRDYWRKKRQTDPHYNIRNRLCSRLWHAIVKYKGTKARLTEQLIGCTVDEARKHIESKFTDGMTWDKFMAGEIHIDHIKPCASFDLSDPAQQFACFHFTNLQPLWAVDNLKKGDKFTSE